MKFVLTLACLSFLLVFPSSARTWTQAASGKKIDAELLRVEGSTAVLRLADGREGRVEVLSLSLEDQEYIASMKNQGSGDSSAAWPAFRGPNGDGISTDEGLLASWPEGGPEKVWVFEDAGMGYSGFSVLDGKLYTMGTRGEDLTVLCVDTATGKEVWSTVIGTDDQSGYSAGWGHGPRSTPTISDGMVFALGPKGTIACLSVEDGKEIWKKNMQADFGGKSGGWGFSASPFVDGEHLILAPGGNKAGLVCLEKKTGNVVWEASEVTPGKAEYATIVPAEINGVKQYVRLFEKELVGVSAEDGSLLWSSPWDGKTAVIPTPIVDGNEIYITSGYGVGCKLVSIDSNNEASDVWINKTMKNHHGGVVKVGDYLYGFSDGGGLICQDWKTGEMVWNEKGQFTSKGSVHIAEGNIYALNEGDGTLTLATATPDGFEHKGQFTLDPQSPNRNPKGKVWTHPLVIGGKLYLRDQEFIVSYDVTAK
ncbi:MAG: PQQ-like beta-propeller repeat protein [Verrucomicrobiales bacterium]|nr:PQQ-like beta-propeller repeat protein [Verrucomicrobiales bacterium]